MVYHFGLIIRLMNSFKLINVYNYYYDISSEYLSIPLPSYHEI